MVERSQVRCPVCRSVVPAMLLWAVGDSCPRCHQALYVRGQRQALAGWPGKPPGGRSERGIPGHGRSQADGSRERDSGARLERRADLVR